MNISRRDWFVLGIVVLLHLSIFIIGMLHFDPKDDKKEIVLQAELLPPPTPSKPKQEEPPKPKPPAQKLPPPPAKMLSVAPAQKQATTQPAEKTAPVTKEKSLPDTPEKSEKTVSNESAKTTEQVAPKASSASSYFTGVDAGPVALNQLVMVYRPDTEVFYPRLSKDIGEQGVVGIQMFIDESGAVTAVKVIYSSGFPRLDKAAGELASRIRFAPYRVNGVATKVNAGISIKFQLH
jgi:periplasmic protein TonB